MSDFNWIFSTTPQIFKKKFYNASDFELKIWWRVSIWKNYFFTKHDFEEKNIFETHAFEEKYTFKKQILKKFCTQNVTFWFKSPRKMYKFCVLCATSKSTIFMKFFFLKSTILNGKSFLKSMILIEKVFLRGMILNQKTLVLSEFESTFHHASYFESKF